MAATSPTTAAPALAPLKPDSWWSKLAVHRVPPTILLLTALASYLIVGLSWLGGAPPWLGMALALIPWAFILFTEVRWTYRHFHWFALFFSMAIIQTIHYSEHCIQVVQHWIFGQDRMTSQAIFSDLHIEGVHFAGDTFLTVGTLILLTVFPRNIFLWIAAPFQVILHQAEHTFLMWEYLTEPVPLGGPGLLAYGGAIGGGLPPHRADLHWMYNTAYTIPFVIALIHQLKKTYDESLNEAFPWASRSELLKASKQLHTFRFAPGETVLSAGDDANYMYIISDGEATVYDHDDRGNPVESGTLSKGQTYGHIGLLVPDAKHPQTVKAKTELTVLAMDEETFRHLQSLAQLPHDTRPDGARAPAAAPATTG